MSEADQTDATSEGSAATTQEPTIPKWRLDEALAQVRAMREELQMKDGLLNQVRQPQQAQGFNYEDMGLDPAMGKAVEKIAEHMVQAKLKEVLNPLQHQNVKLANDLEETRFLQQYGNDKAKELAEIRAQRAQHWAQYKQYQPIEDAYAILQYRKSLQKKPEPKPAAAATPPAGQAPAGDQTPPAQSGPKSFAEMTIAEKEAYFEQQAGGFTI